MTPSARLASAIEILALVDAERRPVAEVVRDWGKAHRFAGSGDRAALTTLVYDALRRRASAAFVMGDDTPRALMLGALALVRGMSVEAVSALCTGQAHAPEPLAEFERARLSHEQSHALMDAPPDVRADCPQWLFQSFVEGFGDDAEAEVAKLAERAPVDMRVNTLRARREEVLAQLSAFGAAPTPHAPAGVRLILPQDGRNPALRGDELFLKGKIELQDEGSQLTSLLTCAQPGEQVLDFCAGAGGKTLALAAQMANAGQIYATDTDARRLSPLHERLLRAGARNVQVRTPRALDAKTRLEAQRAVLRDLEQNCDLVVLDAPCTGTGAWRRNPDAKWRIRQGALGIRRAEQSHVLEEGARYVKRGGRLAYITCSLLRAENEDQIAAFLAAHADFIPHDMAHLCARARLPMLAPFVAQNGCGLTLSPRRCGTDGFYIASLLRVA